MNCASLPQHNSNIREIINLLKDESIINLYSQ